MTPQTRNTGTLVPVDSSTSSSIQIRSGSGADMIELRSDLGRSFLHVDSLYRIWILASTIMLYHLMIKVNRLIPLQPKKSLYHFKKLN